MRKTCGLLMALVLLTSTNCATITRGTTDVLVIESEPAGARVTTSTGLAGKTPCSFTCSRKGGFVVKIELDGYETVEVQVNSKVAGAGAAGMAGNVILGGFIGAAVDAGSGAMRDLVPNPIKVKLVPVKKPSDAQPTSSSEQSALVYLRWVRVAS